MRRKGVFLACNLFLSRNKLAVHPSTPALQPQREHVMEQMRFTSKGVRNMETVEMGLREASTEDARRILEEAKKLTWGGQAGGEAAT